MVTDRVPIEATILLEAAHEVPPIVPNPFQQGLGGVPRIEEDIVRMAAQAIAGIAEELERQRIFRGAPFMPEAHPQRNPERPIRPYQQDKGKAIDGPMLLAGEDPGEAFYGRGKGLGDDRVIEHERASFPGEQGAQGAFEESLPRPLALYHPCQAVMRHGFQCLSQSDTAARCAIIEQCGEIEPNERWHGVPSFVTVGSELYSISSLLRNPW